MAVEVKVADDRHVNAALIQRFDDPRHGGGSLVVVDGEAHQFGACLSQNRSLFGGGLDVGRVCIGHRLDDYGSLRADANVSDKDCGGFSTLHFRHKNSLNGATG